MGKGKRLAILLLILIVLIGLAAGYVMGGLQAYSRYQQSSLANQEHCGGQSPVHICVQAPSTIFSAFYPSYVTAHTTLFIVQYSSTTPITLVVSVNVQGFSQLENRTVNATTNVQSISFTPPLNSAMLRQLTTDDSTSLHVRVTDTQNNLYYVSDSPLLLHSRWLMQWVAANRLKIAAWVTYKDSAVAMLVNRAINHLASQPPPVPAAMIGYENKASPRAVRDQVDAIFDALRVDYNIYYVQAPVPYAGADDTSGGLQNIRLPAEVLQQHRGMCIELTALLAAAVESIGLHAEIVIIPGHAFLGVAVTPDNTQFEYWDAVEVNNKVAGDSANLSTDNEYRQNANAKQIVDTIVISDARRQGIVPML